MTDAISLEESLRRVAESGRAPSPPATTYTLLDDGSMHVVETDIFGNVIAECVCRLEVRP